MFTALAIVLTKGMFGSEFNQTGDAFGLKCGQMRPTEHKCIECGFLRSWATRVPGPAHRVPSKSDFDRHNGGWRDVYPTAYCECKHFVSKCEKVTHNSGWYNSKGEKLGWGDLCTCDLLRLAKECGEVFYICPESSFWDFVRHNPGTIGSECRTAPEESAPGIEYVRKYANWIITPEGKGTMMSVIHINDYRVKPGEANSESWGAMTYIECNRADMDKYVSPAPISAPKVRARLDEKGTAKGLTEIVAHHPNNGHCIQAGIGADSYTIRPAR